MDFDLTSLLQAAILEDAPTGDISSMLSVSETTQGTANIYAKAPGVFFGSEIILSAAALITPSLAVVMNVQNGAQLIPDQVICTLTGSMKSLLLVERTVLNFLQRLSGVATTTQWYVNALDDTNIQLLDTRKTTPLFRTLEKAAVLSGGGGNHRMGLSDMVMLKENHLIQLEQDGRLPDLESLLLEFKQTHPGVLIEIEIESLSQLSSLSLKHADFILLDNFSIRDLKQAIAVISEKGYSAKIEVSGNITLENIGHYRHLPIHRISVGALTHSVHALDLSMRVQ